MTREDAAESDAIAVNAVASETNGNESRAMDFGFRSGLRGPHASRTMMLNELRDLLEVVPSDAAKTDYRAAIMDDNALGKRTVATRRESYERLGWFYALDNGTPIFRLLRFFWDLDEQARPMLALTCACARDPLLRMTSGVVLAASIGQEVSNDDFDSAVVSGTKGHFNEPTQIKIARNAASSWTQSGHLEGRRGKRRAKPVVTPANVAYSLVLGYAEGARGPLLFDTFWTKLLSTGKQQLTDLAVRASQLGWIKYRQAGAVIDVGFSDLLTDDERERIDEQD